MALALCTTSACMVDGDDEARDLELEGTEQLAPLDRLMVETLDDIEDGETTLPPPAADGFAADTTPSAVLPGFDVSISAVGSDVHLSWAEIEPGTVYDVYRSEKPYYIPGGTTSELIADDVTGLSWVDSTGALDKHYFYQVKAFLPNGFKQKSTTVGKKVTKVYKGYTKFSQCLITDIDTSAEFFADFGPSASTTHMWDASVQNWTTMFNGHPGDGHSFPTGEVYSSYITEGHPEYYYTTGYVPAEDDVAMDLQPGDNLVTILPARFGDIMASELLAAVPHSTRIGLWDAEQQQTLWYPGVADYQVPSCSDVHVEVDQPSAWPPPLPECPCTANMPIIADIVAGTTNEPADFCHDDEAVSIAGTYVPGEEGYLVGNHEADTPNLQYQVSVGPLTQSFVDGLALDQALVGVNSCVAYDNRQGQAEILYQLISEDEVRSCEADLRAAISQVPEMAYCAD